MSRLSRRNLIAAGVGASGLVLGGRIAERYGLVPPDSGGVYGPGATLTYAAHRLLTRHSMAREFTRDQISKFPFPNSKPPSDETYTRLKDGGFAGWQLQIAGMVASPGTFSLTELKRMPATSQITHLACEEGWSFIAEWIGVPLHRLLETAGILPQAKYVVYHSMEADWWDSIDMADALHPQTLVTYAMNGADLPLGHGGPLRLRVPRQLGYKSVKYLTGLTVTDSMKDFDRPYTYAWYAGI